MKIDSPVGEYDYRLDGVRFHDGRLEVIGHLGQWQTKTIFERSDLLNLLRKSAFPLVLVTGLLAVTRRLRRV